MKRHRAALLQRAPRAACDRTGALRLRLEPPLQPRLRPVRARGDGGGPEGFPRALAQPARRRGAVPVPGESFGARAVVPVPAAPAAHPALGGRPAPAGPCDPDATDHPRDRHAPGELSLRRGRLVHADDAGLLVAAGPGHPAGAAPRRCVDARLHRAAFLAALKAVVPARRAGARGPGAAPPAARAARLPGGNARDHGAGAQRRLDQGDARRRA